MFKIEINRLLAKKEKGLHCRSGTYRQAILVVFALWICLLILGCNNTSTANPLFFRAASEGRVDILTSFLNAGLDVNSREQEGETPLMYAAVNGHTEACIFLISKGAEVNAISKNNETALGRASLSGHADTIKALLRHGADVNKSANGNGTPLMYASMAGHLEAVKIMLANRAAVNIWTLAKKSYFSVTRSALLSNFR